MSGQFTPAMPDQKSLSTWIIKGLGGVVNMLAAMAANGVKLSRDEGRELLTIYTTMENACTTLIENGEDLGLPPGET